MVDSSDKKGQPGLAPQFGPDIQQAQREKDLLSIAEYLKNHDLFGNIFTKYWSDVKNYVRLEEYHKDVIFAKYNGHERKIHILFSGSASAYVITKDSPKPLPVHTFHPNDLLSDLGALFLAPKHYGFHALEDCIVITLDLAYLEHHQTNNHMYSNFMNLVYNETCRLSVDIFNYMLKNQINLDSLLGNVGFFPLKNKFNMDDLIKLSKNMRYIFFPANEVLIDQFNNKFIYFIESGSIEVTRTYKDKKHSKSYLRNKKLESIYVNNNKVVDGKLLLAFEQEHDDNIMLSSGDTADKINYDQVIIKENVYRYGTVGDDNIGEDNKVEISAMTITPSLLLEINLKELVAKDNIFKQVACFFNNKIRELENNLFIKQQIAININSHKFEYLQFAFFIVVFIAFLNIVSGFVDNSYFTLTTQVPLVYHASIISLMAILLAYLIRSFNFKLSDFSLVKKNLQPVIFEAVIFAIVTMIITTLHKALWIDLFAYNDPLFKLDLFANNHLGLMYYIIFFILFLAYSFLSALYIRGIIQNIFLDIIIKKTSFKFWGAILASSVIEIQLYFSLFNEFGGGHVIGTLAGGILFNRTRNLWALFLYSAIYHTYLVAILGVLASSLYT